MCRDPPFLVSLLGLATEHQHLWLRSPTFTTGHTSHSSHRSGNNSGPQTLRFSEWKLKCCNQATLENLPPGAQSVLAARSGCFLEKSGLKAAWLVRVPEARREQEATGRIFYPWSRAERDRQRELRRRDSLTKCLSSQLSPLAGEGPQLSPVASARPRLVPLCDWSLHCKGQCTHMNPYTKQRRVCGKYWNCRNGLRLSNVLCVFLRRKQIWWN